MEYGSYIIVFFCSWMILLHIILPIGLKDTKDPQQGHAKGAPENPRLALKFLITTIVSIIMSIIIVNIINSGYLSFLTYEI